MKNISLTPNRIIELIKKDKLNNTHYTVATYLLDKFDYAETIDINIFDIYKKTGLSMVEISMIIQDLIEAGLLSQSLSSDSDLLYGYKLNEELPDKKIIDIGVNQLYPYMKVLPKKYIDTDIVDKSSISHVKEFKVVTLCGSTKFKEEFMNIGRKLTLAGYVVLNLEVFSKADNITLSKDELDTLEKIHYQRIDMSDEIFVIDKNGYIGEGCSKEIMYAIENNKKVRYMSKYITENNKGKVNYMSKEKIEYRLKCSEKPALRTKRDLCVYYLELRKYDDSYGSIMPYEHPISDISVDFPKAVEYFGGWAKLPEHFVFRNDFMNDCKDYIEWESLVSNQQLSSKQIRLFAKYIPWDDISVCNKLSSDIMIDFKDKINWINASYNQKFTMEDLRVLKDYVYWKGIWSNIELDVDEIEEFIQYADWFEISMHQKLSENFMRKYKDYLYWEVMSETQVLSEELITDVSDEVDWLRISMFQKLSETFIVDNLNKVDIFAILKNQDLSVSYRHELTMLLSCNKYF